jgi:hypothetical protein
MLGLGRVTMTRLKIDAQKKAKPIDHRKENRLQ